MFFVRKNRSFEKNRPKKIGNFQNGRKIGPDGGLQPPQKGYKPPYNPPWKKVLNYYHHNNNDNSPGHWPIGVLDNQLYWLIVPPIVPHWAQDPGELTFPMMVVPRFSFFLAFEKMVKNRPFNFHVFLSFFVIFVEFLTNYEPFWVNSGTSWDLFFDVFFDHLFCLVCCVIFSQISKKKWKSKKCLKHCACA